MALRLALDVNRYGDYCRAAPDVVANVRRAHQIVLPFVVVAELRAGFRLGTQTVNNERVLSRILQSDRTEVVIPDEATTHVYAALHADLRRAGTPIPTNDLWIAAIVVQHELVLYTRDRHFDLVPRLVRL